MIGDKYQLFILAAFFIMLPPITCGACSIEELHIVYQNDKIHNEHRRPRVQVYYDPWVRSSFICYLDNNSIGIANINKQIIIWKNPLPCESSKSTVGISYLKGT